MLNFIHYELMELGIPYHDVSVISRPFDTHNALYIMKRSEHLLTAEIKERLQKNNFITTIVTE